MERYYNEEARTTSFFTENFDCNKMKSLVREANSNVSFADRFRNWITQQTREAKDKVWFDVESYRSR